MTKNYYKLNAIQQEILIREIENITKYIYKHLNKKNRPKLYEMNYNILDIINSKMSEGSATNAIQRYFIRLDFDYMINYSKRRIITHKITMNKMDEYHTYKNDNELRTYLYYEFEFILEEMYFVVENFNRKERELRKIKKIYTMFLKWLKEIKL